MKMYYHGLIIIVNIIASIFLPSKISAILDGRTAPIYLDTRYTFTNFEWARGNVYFKDGFDLPTNGTAILDITQKVGANINFDNSTLILNDDLTLGYYAELKGDGFVDAQLHTIFITHDQVFNADDNLIFTSDVIFQGLGDSRIHLPGLGDLGSMAFTNNITRVHFHDIDIVGLSSNKFYTSYTGPLLLNFSECNLNMKSYSTAALNSKIVFIQGNCHCKGTHSKLEIPSQLQLADVNGILTVDQGITLAPRIIVCQTFQAQLILNNATLEYTTTDLSFPMYYGTTTPPVPQGNIIINGKSQIKANPNTTLILEPLISLHLLSGSRLTYDAGVSLRIR